MSNEPSNFDKAVSLICELLASERKNEISNRAVSGDFNALDLAQKFGTHDESLAGFAEMLIEPDQEQFILRSQKDRNCFDTLLFYASFRVRHQLYMDPKLRVFLADYLLGELKAPARAGGQKRSSSEGNYRKAQFIKVASLQGLKPTRNEATQHTSACDAVAAAAISLKLGGYSYSNLARIWSKRPSSIDNLGPYLTNISTFGIRDYG